MIPIVVEVLLPVSKPVHVAKMIVGELVAAVEIASANGFGDDAVKMLARDHRCKTLIIIRSGGAVQTLGCLQTLADIASAVEARHFTSAE